MLREFVPAVPFPALKESGNFTVPLKFIEVEVNKRKPLVEQEIEKTETALKALGVNIFSPPAALEGIDQVRNLEPITERDIQLGEVIGMPNTAKNTFIARLRQSYPETVISTPEPFEFLTKHDKEFKRLYRGDALRRESSEAEWAFLNSFDGDASKTVITNRSSQDYDMVWRRTFFLAGLSMSFNNLTLSELKPSSIASAIYVFLAQPETSLQREPKGAHGPFMNPNFLRILYSQYLRLIYELRDRKNLTVIDMSGTKKESYRKFLGLYQQVFGQAIEKPPSSA